MFKLDTTGKETVLYAFNNGSDGAEPNSIVRDATGNIYGTTAYGGTCGGGIAFKLDTKGRFQSAPLFRGGRQGRIWSGRADAGCSGPALWNRHELGAEATVTTITATKLAVALSLSLIRAARSACCTV